MKRFNLFLVLGTCCLTAVTGICSCKKFVTVSAPETQLSSNNVFTNDASATAAILGIYSKMMESSSGFASGTQSISLLTGLSSDELTNYSTNSSYAEFYDNSLSVNNPFLLSIWAELYTYINNSNAAMEGLETQNGVSPSVKKQLEGEAKFIRAFCYFQLTNLFGSVPLITSTDYKAAATDSRSSASLVFQQIILDLTDAQSLLNEDYVAADNTLTFERVRPNKYTATALLAKAYLYTGDWKNAEAQSTAIINNMGLYTLNYMLDSVFLANSSEAIWQLKPVFPGFNTFDGLIFVLTTYPAYTALDSQLLNAFEPGDLRKANWTDSIKIDTNLYHFPYKYKIGAASEVSEYLMVFRLAEQYLIRAESRAQQGNLSGSQTDLNIIRNRAGLSNTSATTQSDLLESIYKERRVELFTEWGHRWFDLKRTGRANTVLPNEKGTGWKSTDTLYPINESIIARDPNINQNAGY